MTRYIGLAEYLWPAEEVTGVPAAMLSRSSRIGFADSALHAPRASFSEEEFYPDIFDKAAVLCKRAAWATLIVFIDLNDGHWDPDPPDVDDVEETMLSVAAGDIDEHALAEWLRRRIFFE